MEKKTDIQMARAERAEIIRTLTRLKHRLAANREINEILPDSLSEFDKAVQEGNLKLLDISEVLNVKTEDL